MFSCATTCELQSNFIGTSRGKTRSLCFKPFQGSFGLSEKTLISVSESLRRRLLPLFCGPDSVVLPSLNYAASVLLFLYHKEIPATPSNAENSPSTWETVIVSIFSSLLVGYPRS